MHSSNDFTCVSNRCASCRALLFKSEPGAIAGVIEIKCRRCGTFNSLRPVSPNPTADRAAAGRLDHDPRNHLPHFPGCRLSRRQAQPGAPDL
ncbi:Com family DNA-binding transcriptional regulator [Sphingobium scionense]